MTKLQPGKELPQASNTPLPYLVQLRVKLSLLSVALPVLLMVTSGVIIMIPRSPETEVLLGVIYAMEILLVIFSIRVTAKIMLARRTVRTTVEDIGEKFLQAVQQRYGIIMSETILYQLIQNRSTTLHDKEGNLTQMMLVSNPETQTSKIVAIETR